MIDYQMIIKGISQGIIAGFAYGMSQYLKKKGQVFDDKKFFATIAISISCGIIMQFNDLELGYMYETAIAGGLLPIIENGIMIFKRKIYPKMLGIFN